ncbi:MAG: metalloregulator ArsR/SmtB family transcription factor [Sphaerochaeta associata]|uniref:ArsR/SmtB family transcription factor n=1 Tax=Sphaerochaeta associata TaxID=1129264 RepID=UPI002B1EBC40|nr:metalloregulator ArsR/SmtB family transcription factor [Sphaerochaeta associata]MEA5107734.1 metalloregulator ArsR/SmtB family transcription factor [Sphaerochaeta associata]
MVIAEYGPILKALADPNRLAIIEHLTRGEACVCELLELFSVTQPTLSHHMRILSEAGLVSGRREGKWIHYSINVQRLQSFKDFIASIQIVPEAKKGYVCQ